MTSLNIDGLTFTFPAHWRASKYDDWSFYRNQFSRQFSCIKAVDVLAISPNNHAFMIEVKDYRHPDATKPSMLPEAIANKVLHTLSAMLPAKLHANENAEKLFAGAILKCAALHVVAHIEQPARHLPFVDPADIKQKLRKLLKAVDPHPQVVCAGNMNALNWTVI